MLVIATPEARPSLARIILTILFLNLVTAPAGVLADESTNVESAGIDERLGDVVPLGLIFTDQEGRQVTLGSLIKRPTILALVYYKCPAVCRPLLDEVAATIEAMDLVPGEDYDVVTLSFDETDDAEASKRVRAEYMSMLERGFPDRAWTFLTGDESSIQGLTEAVGFRFNKFDEDYAHPTALIVLSRKGKICRYLLGADYLPADLKMAIAEASENRTGGTIPKFARFCFSYDPEGGRYVLNVTRFVGAGMLLCVAGFVVFLAASGRRRSPKSEPL